MIEGAVCVSQKNTREVLMKAIEMIKGAIEEETGCECNHNWEAQDEFSCRFDELGGTQTVRKYKCKLCGETECRKI